MKAVYVYSIDGKKIAVWARSTDEAKERIEEVLGNVKAEFLGVFVPKFHDRYSGIGPKPDMYLEDIEDSVNNKCIKDLEKLGWRLASSDNRYNVYLNEEMARIILTGIGLENLKGTDNL